MKNICKDCNKLLEGCTCIEDTIDMKQETLEEAALNYALEQHKLSKDVYVQDFYRGAKWQAERMLELMDEYVDDVMGGCNLTAKEWFEQFNKEKY
jgi:hypothetical protein